MTYHQALGPGRGRFTVGLSVRNPDRSWAVDPVLSGACNPCHKPGFEVTLKPRSVR